MLRKQCSGSYRAWARSNPARRGTLTALPRRWRNKRVATAGTEPGVWAHLPLLQLLLLLHLQLLSFKDDRKNQDHEGSGSNPQGCPGKPARGAWAWRRDKDRQLPKNELVTKPLTLHTPMFLINVFHPTLHRTPARNRRSSSGGCIFNKSLNWVLTMLLLLHIISHNLILTMTPTR